MLKKLIGRTNESYKLLLTVRKINCIIFFPITNVSAYFQAIISVQMCNITSFVDHENTFRQHCPADSQ